jgi:hypothetical protein
VQLEMASVKKFVFVLGDKKPPISVLHISGTSAPRMVENILRLVMKKLGATSEDDLELTDKEGTAVTMDMLVDVARGQGEAGSFDITDGALHVNLAVQKPRKNKGAHPDHPVVKA